VEAIALRQIELIERLLRLQLHRYSNAPENAGWMRLFQKWATLEPVRAAMRTQEAASPTISASSSTCT
jgi:hypothetical protein